MGSTQRSKTAKGDVMQEKGYKKLIVWRKSDELAYQIYRTTKDFPREERSGITSQL
jgi:hypothetical protein